MIFGFGIGSKNTEKELYTLRLPITLQAYEIITNLDKKNNFILDNYTLKIEKENSKYILVIEGFETNEKAQLYITKIENTLYRMTVIRNIAILFSSIPEKIHLWDEPQKVSKKSMYFKITNKNGWNEVDGDYSSLQTVIVPEHKRLLKESFGNITLTSSFTSDKFADIFRKEFKLSNGIPLEEKLKLAIEVYSSYFFEQNSVSKFLKLVMVLEILKKEENSEKHIIDFINKTMEKINVLKNNDIKNSESYDYLKSRVGNLKKISIKNAVLNFIENTYSKDKSNEEIKNIKQKIKGYYNLRSRILHEGKYDAKELNQSISTLQNIIANILEIMINNEN